MFFASTRFTTISALPTGIMGPPAAQPDARPTPSTLAEFQRECGLAFPAWAPYCAPSCNAVGNATSGIAARDGMLVVPGSFVSFVLMAVVTWLMLWIAVTLCRKSLLPTLFVLLPAVTPGVVLYLYFDMVAGVAHSYFLWVVIVLSAACFLLLLCECSGILHLLRSFCSALRDYIAGRGWTWRMGYFREENDDDGWDADVRRIRRRMNF